MARTGRDAGAWLKARREELGLSLTQVQLKSGGAVNGSTLSKVENGRRPPSPELLLALAPVYRVDVRLLYELAGFLPPEGGTLPQPEPPKPVTWSDIEEMIRHSEDLNLEQKRGLIIVWKSQYEAAQAAAEKARRRGRKASG